MKRRSVYRIAIVVALVGLTGLLVVQVSWFLKAYRLQEQQFDVNVNLALREVTNQLLQEANDRSSSIAPVRQSSANAFHVSLNRNIEYGRLDAILRTVFKQHQILVPFELSVVRHKTTDILFGNFYKQGVLSTADVTCLNREKTKGAAMDFSIIFPEKKSNIAGSMDLWIFSAFTFLAILVLFGFMIIDLSKQKRLAEIKADFINNMTHELQTPITNIHLASEVLKRSGEKIGDEKKAHYVDIIHAENQRLKRQVEQVLQTAMLEKGEIELRKTDVNVNSIIAEAVQSFQLRVNSRQGKIKTNLNATQPLVFGDPFHLTNIVYSLLDNADKYSESNPDITVTTINKNDGILIAVADKGIGIKKEIQQFIFDKFYRGASGNVHDVKGFGLGLTYVREIVSAHQGKVSVSSEVNNGSIFELYFKNA